MELASEALIFAVNAHDGMRRKKSTVPYILHPAEAAAIVGTMTDRQEVIAAAALHDVVEDAGVTLEQIKQRFGARVAELVASETENKRTQLPAKDTWKIRKEEAIKELEKTTDKDIKILYLGDKLSNMRCIYQDWLREGDAMWQRFNETDPCQQAWYYRTIASCLSSLSAYPAWQEYNKLVNTVFENR